jgi:SAM-dependent methyltransferase
MPTVLKTVIPRIRKSLREKGLAGSVRRSFLLPLHLWREYRAARTLRAGGEVSDFDRAHLVETDGEYDGWTYLSDLDIPSSNWIEAYDYAPIEPERFEQVLASLDIRFEEFTFIDFGSGKGRALLLASEYPFEEILGLEFSPELHRVAEENIRRYGSATQRCGSIQSLNVDFLDFELPARASVLFFFNPCRGRVLAEVAAKIKRSVLASPRAVYVAYVAPTVEQMQLFAATGVLEEICRNDEINFRVYRASGAAEAYPRG